MERGAASAAAGRPVVLAKIVRALNVVGELCRGDREWLMSIPARPDHDPDILISDALNDARKEIGALTREVHRVRGALIYMMGVREIECLAPDKDNCVKNGIADICAACRAREVLDSPVPPVEGDRS